MKNQIIPYNPKLKLFARELRKQGVLSEVLLWKKIKNKSLGVEFHRQVPIDNYIVDFFCHELMLAIEIDGKSHEMTETEKNDILREQKLITLGIEIIRFKEISIFKNMNDVIRCLQVKIEETQINIPLNPPSKGE